MAAAQTIPAQGVQAARGTLPVQPNTESAIQQTSVLQLPESGARVFSPLIERLPVELDVAVPIREFRVHNLLALEPGQLIESQWGSGEDLPLASGAVHLAWGEFEEIDDQLAVRITRLE